MKQIRNFDIFPKFDSKFEADAREKTIFGAAFSVLAFVVIVVLVIGEVRYFMSTVEKHELFVDTTVGGDLHIFLNVSFPQVPCDLMTLDAVNAFGEFQEDMDKKTVKHRINQELHFISKAREIVNDKREATVPKDEQGNVKEGCGSCYGAEVFSGECCNTCNEVEAAYQRRGWHFNINDIGIKQCATERLKHAASVSKHEGCNIVAHLEVARVQGNIHFIPGRAFTILGQHMHDLAGEEIAKLNLSHVIHSLQFGTKFYGQENPLDGKEVIITQGETNGRFNYYVKVVPTRVEKSTTGTLETNQYSVTEHFTMRTPEQSSNPQGNQQFIPGIFFVYDLSPIRVRMYEEHPYSSVVHFLLQLCAIAGGVFTVMGIVDAIFYHSVISVRRKLQLGKQN